MSCQFVSKLNAQTFASDTRGNVAMIVGLLTFITFTFMGAAVDLGRWLHARTVTMDSMESATLAGLRSYQETGNSAAAEALALKIYKSNTLGRPSVRGDNVSFKLQNDGNTISMLAQGNAEYQTLFLAVLPQLLDLKVLPLLRKDNTEQPVSTLAVGKNSGTHIELSMMVDITGSMDSTDSTGKKKIESLRESAQKLVDIVIWQDQSEYTSRVALVPFSEAVNLGTSRATLARGTPSNTYNGKNANNSNDSWKLSTVCVTERTGTDRYTDTSYTTARVGAKYSTSGSCDTQSELIALSDDKTALTNAIKALPARGVTAGQMGTAWAWYTLAPNFNSLWGHSKHNARPYSEITTMNQKGKPVLKKIALLMTDGAYNTQHCNGVADKNSTNYNSNDRENCTSPNGSSTSQAAALCTAMKAKGIIVYTVGFMVSTSQKNMLTACATSKENFYDAANGTQLMQAFTDIAYKQVPPFVSR